MDACDQLSKGAYFSQVKHSVYYETMIVGHYLLVYFTKSNQMETQCNL